MDPRSYVRPGERLRVAASQINALNAMMRPNVGFQADADIGYKPIGDVILARNDTGNDLARWGVMKINGIVIDPNDGENEERAFEGMPCVIGATASLCEANAVVAIEPINDGKIGRVVVSGVVQIKATDILKVGNSDVLWKHTDWAIIRIGSAIKIGKITGSWTKGTTKTVTLLNADGTTTVNAATFTARNLFANISVDCGERKVACAVIDSTWTLIDAEC